MSDRMGSIDLECPGGWNRRSGSNPLVISFRVRAAIVFRSRLFWLSATCVEYQSERHGASRR